MTRAPTSPKALACGGECAQVRHRLRQRVKHEQRDGVPLRLPQGFLFLPVKLEREIGRHDRGAPRLDAVGKGRRGRRIRLGAQELDQIPDFGVAEARRESGHRRSRNAMRDPPEELSRVDDSTSARRGPLAPWAATPRRDRHPDHRGRGRQRNSPHRDRRRVRSSPSCSLPAKWHRWLDTRAPQATRRKSQRLATMVPSPGDPEAPPVAEHARNRGTGGDARNDAGDHHARADAERWLRRLPAQRVSERPHRRIDARQEPWCRAGRRWPPRSFPRRFRSSHCA